MDKIVVGIGLDLVSDGRHIPWVNLSDRGRHYIGGVVWRSGRISKTLFGNRRLEGAVRLNIRRAAGPVRRAPTGRPEASLSQGDRWKRLISRYMVVMPSIGRMLEPEEQSVIGGASFAAIHAISAKVGEAARATQPATSRACQPLALSLFAAADFVIFRLPIDCRRSRPCRIERGCKARRKLGESDKCDGISVHSLITAAAGALAAGDPLAALKRVTLPRHRIEF